MTDTRDNAGHCPGSVIRQRKLPWETRDNAGHCPGSIIRQHKLPCRAQDERGDCRPRKSRGRWLLAAVALATPAAAQLDPPAWTQPPAPFNLLANVDYVGTEGLGAYLIRTPAGAILIDAPMEENVAAIERSIAARGVKLGDVKLILLSHAHFDHAGGLAALKRATGAKLVVGARDRSAVESGVPPSDTSYGVVRFPAAQVDRAVRHGETVRLGDTTLTALDTAGHTPGCTSWRMQVRVNGAPRELLFACSLTVAGNRLKGNTGYPGIVADFERTFVRAATWRPDVLLTFHPDSADLRARAAAGTLADHTAWPRALGEARRAFDAEQARTGR